MREASQPKLELVSLLIKSVKFDLGPVHTAHAMRIESGLMRIGLRSHCQGVNAH